jgi:hypothetical protein
MRREEWAPREHRAAQPLLEPDSLKRGLEALSNQRVEGTLLAEAGELVDDIEKFRRGKAEHGPSGLRDMLGEGYVEKIRLLQQIGFLEPIGLNYKIPMLYRAGLGITQGKIRFNIRQPQLLTFFTSLAHHKLASLDSSLLGRLWGQGGWRNWTYEDIPCSKEIGP